MKRQYMFMVILVLLLSLSLTLPLVAQEEMPLGERGSYHVGTRQLSFVDEQREDRQIRVDLWFPAVVPEAQDVQGSEEAHIPVRNLAPDTNGAPYPLVLYSHGHTGSATEFSKILEPLVSHGFVVANPQHPNETSALTMIDRPLDIVFVIEQLAALNEDASSDLAGLMNVDQTGVIGFSQGAYTALSMSGARIDTEAASQVADLFGDFVLSSENYGGWDWRAMAEYHDQLVPPIAGDPLWPPVSDPRIRAVVAYAPCWAEFLGDRGLAAATVPALLIGLTEDRACPYMDDAVRDYVRMRSAERYLLTLVGASHDYPNVDTAPVVQQFVTAFFGYHLQGKSEYSHYLTADYADRLDNVVWGIDAAAISTYSWRPGEKTVIDGGPVAAGDDISGEIAEMGSRVRYTLTLGNDASLNVSAIPAGPRTNNRSGMAFDPALYVYDAQDNLLYWCNETAFGDATLFDASIEWIELSAGSYTIEVRGFADVVSGPYELVVERAE